LRHIIPISGKDSAATALVQIARAPELPYEFIFCDVKMELPETYAWLDKLATTLGITIKTVGKSLREVIDEQNMLPSQGRRFCTKYGKIFPIRDFIEKDAATQYFGIRADETGRAGWSGPANVVAKYPLVELGLGIRNVYQILGDRGIMPPLFFWERLFDAVWKRANQTKRAIIDSLSPWDRSALFSWRSRSNCFMCFYQRRYEWVGLLEHHPDLFEDARQIEIAFGTPPLVEAEFHWIPGMSLEALRERAPVIFAKRVRDVLKILQKREQGTFFGSEYDALATTSCGLFCGK
jgi:hypothetical protein